MPNMLLVENQGVDVYDYLCQGVMWTILSNTCRDLPEEVAKEMVGAFPHLKISGSSIIDPEDAQIDKLETEVNELKEEVATPKEQFEESLRKEEKFFCSVCGREFQKMQGLRIHQKVHE